MLKDINRGDYEEFMNVRKKGQELVMLARAEGGKFREFLLVAGGEDNVIVQIKGTLSLRDAKKISAGFSHDHDMNLVSHRN